jgi:hypothetical protein
MIYIFVDAGYIGSNYRRQRHIWQVYYPKLFGYELAVHAASMWGCDVEKGVSIILYLLSKYMCFLQLARQFA